MPAAVIYKLLVLWNCNGFTTSSHWIQSHLSILRINFDVGNKYLVLNDDLNETYIATFSEVDSYVIEKEKFGS